MNNCPKESGDVSLETSCYGLPCWDPCLKYEYWADNGIPRRELEAKLDGKLSDLEQRAERLDYQLEAARSVSPSFEMGRRLGQFLRGLLL